MVPDALLSALATIATVCGRSRLAKHGTVAANCLTHTSLVERAEFIAALELASRAVDEIGFPGEDCCAKDPAAATTVKATQR